MCFPPRYYTIQQSLIIFWQRNGFLSLSITHIFIQTYVRNFTTLSTLNAFFSCWLRIRFLRLRRESECVEKEEYWVVRVSTTMIPSHVRQLSPNFPLIFWQRAMDHKLLWIFHNTCQKLLWIVKLSGLTLVVLTYAVWNWENTQV